LAVEDERSNRRLAHIARGKTVAIVFIDVAGFTTLTEQRGDDEAIALLNRLSALIDRAVKLGQGECVKKLGDGFLLAFPSSSQAIRSMLALRQAMAREGERDRSFDLKLRTAIHAGEPLIEEDDLLGHDVNLTARLLDHCRPGEIIVSEAAKELAGRRLKSVSFGKSRTRKIRGLSSKVVVYPIAVAESGMHSARPKTDPSKTAQAVAR
ncbi:MAG: adenylate/guanylate cyclase domain-containing protein, partial [Actinomycetota bacterium]